MDIKELGTPTGNDTDPFLLAIVKMKPKSNKKTIYAKITREINRSFNCPVVILFYSKQEGAEKNISLSFIDRRRHKKQELLDVLGEVSILHNINCSKPHRAHLEIINKLQDPSVNTYSQLMEEWLKVLNIDKLNERFYGELFQWYKATVDNKQVKLPLEYKIKKIDGQIERKNTTREEQIIRLITRFLFVWFIKEKGVVPEKLFSKEDINNLLADFNQDKGDNYYFAILQNLFFATLNTPLKDEKGQRRKFSNKQPTKHRVFNVWRHKDMLQDPDKFISIMNKIPFVNGGLFECLDSIEASKDPAGYRLDCFSDNPNQRKELSLPNHLFFGKNDDGIIDIFNRYKFTVEENTPLDIEVALDPELLGKTFENLLASYNPETRDTARKSTGSYYTPRRIVKYMVISSLKEYLTTYLTNNGNITNTAELDAKLDALFKLEVSDNPFDIKDSDSIIKAINNIKIIDPAVGSGAFPMELLHNCVELLQKLDPENKKWKEEQLNNLPELQQLAKDISIAQKINLKEAQDSAKQEIKKRQEKIEVDFNKLNHNYLRKLYLIRNNIYGVDIQPIACQIAKLRFFISLTVEQDFQPDKPEDNFNISSLPNLETNFISADTLMNLYRPLMEDLTMDEIYKPQERLKQNRDAIFLANSYKRKKDLAEQDEEIRRELKKELEEHYKPILNNAQNSSKTKGGGI